MRRGQHSNGHHPPRHIEYDDLSLLGLEDGDDELTDDLAADTAVLPEGDSASEDAALAQFLQDMEPEGDLTRHPFFQEETLTDTLETAVSATTRFTNRQLEPEDAYPTVSPPLEIEAGEVNQPTTVDPVRRELALLKYLAWQSARAQDPMRAAAIAAVMPSVALRTQPDDYHALWPAMVILAPEVWQVVYAWYGERQNKRHFQRLPVVLLHTVAQLAQRLQQDKPLNRTIVLATFKRELQSRRSFA